jgi:hypothetical protein
MSDIFREQYNRLKSDKYSIKGYGNGVHKNGTVINNLTDSYSNLYTDNGGTQNTWFRDTWETGRDDKDVEWNFKCHTDYQTIDSWCYKWCHKYSDGTMVEKPGDRYKCVYPNLNAPVTREITVFPKYKKITLYDQNNYKGNSKVLYKASNFGDFQNKVKSLKVEDLNIAFSIPPGTLVQCVPSDFYTNNIYNASQSPFEQSSLYYYYANNKLYPFDINNLNNWYPNTNYQIFAVKTVLPDAQYISPIRVPPKPSQFTNSDANDGETIICVPNNWGTPQYTQGSDPNNVFSYPSITSTVSSNGYYRVFKDTNGNAKLVKYPSQDIANGWGANISLVTKIFYTTSQIVAGGINYVSYTNELSLPNPSDICTSNNSSAPILKTLNDFFINKNNYVFKFSKGKNPDNKFYKYSDNYTLEQPNPIFIYEHNDSTNTNRYFIDYNFYKTVGYIQGKNRLQPAGVTFSDTMTNKQGYSVVCLDDSLSKTVYHYSRQNDYIMPYITEQSIERWRGSNWKESLYAFYCIQRDPSGNWIDYRSNDYMPQSPPTSGLIVRCDPSKKGKNNPKFKDAYYRIYNDSSNNDITLRKFSSQSVARQYNNENDISTEMADCRPYNINDTDKYYSIEDSIDKTGIRDGQSILCNKTNNTPFDNNIYRYVNNEGSAVGRLYKYNDIQFNRETDEFSGNGTDLISSWDPDWRNFKEYVCDISSVNYSNPVVINQRRPLDKEALKCNDISKNSLYFIYDLSTNILKTYTNLESLKREKLKIDPNWKDTNISIYNKDICPLFKESKTMFYSGSAGTGDVTPYSYDSVSNCIEMPFQFDPKSQTDRSINRNGIDVLLYSDSSCNNSYSKVSGVKDRIINIPKSDIKAYGSIIEKSNPDYYKVSDKDITVNVNNRIGDIVI